MNEALEIALAAHRALRDWGNTILVIGILVEIGIEGFWPEYTDNRWQFSICTLKRFCIFLAGLVLLYGLWRERTEGILADTAADRIRANLQERIIAISPRNWLLPQSIESELAMGLKAYTGQRVAIRTNKREVASDPYGEIGLTQSAIAKMLDDSRWLNPWGGRIMKSVTDDGSFCTDCLEDSGNTFVTGIVIEADFRASTNTKNAAQALWDALKSQHFNVLDGLVQLTSSRYPPGSRR
jgi:hypothetical protein